MESILLVDSKKDYQSSYPPRFLDWPFVGERFKVIIEVGYIGRGYIDVPKRKIVSVSGETLAGICRQATRLNNVFENRHDLAELLASHDLMWASGRYEAELVFHMELTYGHIEGCDEADYGFSIEKLAFLGHDSLPVEI